ncbi:hypothetical protein Sjap_002894 [Stephania japonica]|uniref:Uncharacterized protein n=1 Tax=Stephania japonica TaxID=461633 RepID=A0AAP0KQ35_9MAGN
MVVKETLRLHPPAPLLAPRECMNHCKVNGYDISPGTRVMVNVWATGRNLEYWYNLNEFRPERFEDSSVDYKGQHFDLLRLGAGEGSVQEKFADVDANKDVRGSHSKDGARPDRVYTSPPHLLCNPNSTTPALRVSCALGRIKNVVMNVWLVWMCGCCGCENVWPQFVKESSVKPGSKPYFRVKSRFCPCLQVIW